MLNRGIMIGALGGITAALGTHGRLLLVGLAGALAAPASAAECRPRTPAAAMTAPQ
jgi:hypothetical protein